MDILTAEYDPDMQPYQQTAAETSTVPSLELLLAVAELLETELDTLLAEMGYTPGEESRTPYNEVMAAR